MGLLLGLLIYTLGGLTFLPGILVIVFYVFPKEPKSIPDLANDLKAGEIEENNHSGLETFKEGWIIVTQTYVESPDELSPSTQTIKESETKSAYSSLYKLVQKDSNIIKENNGVSTNDSANSFSMDTNVSTPNSNDKKHRYFAVLKHGNLFLYKDETLKHVKHVIVLSNHIVTIWPLNLLEAQLFTKYSAIAIMSCTNLNAKNLKSINKPPKGTFFIYTDITSDKEDWWFELIRSTKQQNEIDESLNPNIYAKTLHFQTRNMIDLIQTLYSSEGQLQTKWLNGLLGRVFLGLQQTDVLKNYIQNKLTKKLDKIKRPGFLDAFQITHVNPGDSAPYFTYPTLKEVSPDGTVIVACHLTYLGNISIHIATKVNINLGIGFKNREVDVVLRITLKKFEGPLLFKIKPPPSERIWYTYEIEPLMELKIEPVIESRNMNFNIITNSIHKKFKESIKESLVLPHWDDICFYDTIDEIYRGGIWDKTHRFKDEYEKSSDNEVLESDNADTTTIDDEKIRSTSMSESLTDRDVLDIDKISLSPSKSPKQKFSAISKRLKTAKSFGSMDLFDGNSQIDADEHLNNAKAATMNTLKKIGKWYFKDGKMEQREEYTPPEMISNRRGRRGSSINDLEKPPIINPVNHKPSYDFRKLADNESMHSNESLEGKKTISADPTLAMSTPSITLSTDLSHDDSLSISHDELILNENLELNTISTAVQAKDDTSFASSNSNPIRRPTRKAPPSSPPPS